MAQSPRFNLRRLLARRVIPTQQPNTDQSVVTSVDETPGSLQQQACCLAESNTPEGFKEAIEKFSKIKDPSIEVLYLRGNAHLKLGGPEHNQIAVNVFTEVIRRLNGPNSPSRDLIAELYYKRAFAHQMLGENNDAVRDYSLFLNYAKNKENGILAKGYLSRGLVYESMNLMRRALQDIDEAIKLTYEKNPYYKYCQERVRIAMSEKDDDEDHDHLDHGHIVRENEDDGDEKLENSKKDMLGTEKTGFEMMLETQNAKYEKLYYDALLCSDQRKYREALKKFINAFEFATNKDQQTDNLFRQGLCQYMLRNRTEAQNLFNKALKYNPKHARAIFRRGMIQAEDDKLIDALRDLSSAYKYAPNDIDILHERANIYEKLGKLNEAMYDRRRAMQLGQLSNKIAAIQDHLRHLKDEIKHKGESVERHFKIGWFQQALYNLRNTARSFREEKGKTNKESNQDESTYKEAVIEYTAAIKIDAENVCPEARALLALCQEGKDFLQAHDVFQSLFKMFDDFPDSIEMWKLFMKNIKEQKYHMEMDAEMSETVLTKLNNIEENRKTIENDEAGFIKNKNLLLFYRTMRIQLANVLAAFALGGCQQEIIAHNMKGSLSTAATILSFVSKGVSYIPNIGSALEAVGNQTGQILEDVDHELIRNRLQIISECGDLIDQCEVAHRVACRLINRYEKQLMQLSDKNEKIDACCCSCCAGILPWMEELDEREPAKRVASFAVNYIISAVADESIKTLGLKQATTKDSLVEMLVQLACRARGPKITVPKCLHNNPNLYLPLISKPKTDGLAQQQQVPPIEYQDNAITTSTATTGDKTQSMSKPNSPVIERFLLYEFFRAPGLCYDPKEDQNVLLASVGEENQQNQEGSINHKHKDQSGAVQHLIANIVPHTIQNQDQRGAVQQLVANNPLHTIQNQDPQDGDRWAKFPYMNPNDYGYRLCSVIELKLMEEEWQNMQKRRVCCTNCCC